MLKRGIAAFLSVVLVLFPAGSNAEIPEIFTNQAMKDKVAVEAFTKQTFIEKTGETDITKLIRFSHINDDNEFIIRTLEIRDNPKSQNYSQNDSTLKCKSLEDKNTCSITSVLTVCARNSAGELTNCESAKRKINSKNLTKKYGTIENAIEEMFFYPLKFNPICKSILDKEEIVKRDMGSMLETESKSFLKTLLAIPLFIVSAVLPIAGMAFGPATTGAASAITNVGIGAGSKIASEVTAGISNRIMTDNPNLQNQNLSECIIEKAPDKESSK